MSAKTIVRHRLDYDNLQGLSPETKARLAAMTDEEVEAAARSDPDAQPLTEEQSAEYRRQEADIAGLRKRLGLSQAAFSAKYRIPIGTLRDWEQGRRKPDAGSRLLLKVIAYAPDVVERALL